MSINRMTWNSPPRNIRRRFVLRLFTCGAALLPSMAYGATAAYWRFEEGPAGSVLPAGNDTVLDASGNGNHLRTFDPVFTSPDYTANVSPLALRSGLPNTLALNFGPGGVDEDRNQTPIGLDDDIYTENKLIQTQLFTAMTIELAFKMDTVGGFQALLGRDGKSLGDAPGEDDSPVPPLKIMVRGDDFPEAVPNQLFVEWIDGDGTLNSDIHSLATRETVLPDTWYHLAFTLTATDAQLWVAGTTGDYLLKDSLTGQDFAGASGEVMVFDPTPFTVGRGAFNNGITDWVDATIDEVRISDAALAPDAFEFLATATPVQDADFNNDNLVDGADFLIWQRGLGGVGTPTTGDANGDEQVNGDDLGIWKSQFGGPPGMMAASGAVPEPEALALIASALLAGCMRGRPGHPQRD
jgi:hypothetical protein